MIQVAILGHGVVGSGVAEVLRKNAAGIAHKAGDAIEIKRILDLREFPETPYADLFTKNFDDILHDADIRIVVETMGGLHPAYEFVKSCLQAGKSVVTSNKELVAAKGGRAAGDREKPQPQLPVRGERGRRHPDPAPDRPVPRGQRGV